MRQFARGWGWRSATNVFSIASRLEPRIRLGEAATGSGLERLAQHLLRIIHGKNQHVGAGMRFENGARGLQPVHARQPQIHDHDIGVGAIGLANGVFAGRRLAADFKALHALQQAGQALTYDFMVVNRQQAGLRLGGDIFRDLGPPCYGEPPRALSFPPLWNQFPGSRAAHAIVPGRP